MEMTIEQETIKKEKIRDLRPSFYGFPLAGLKQYLTEQGYSHYVAAQIFGWIYKMKVYDPDLWTNVGMKLRAHLKETFTFSLPEVAWQAPSVDGTRKFLLRMVDGKTVEAVVIVGPDRLTLCISSQVGCAMKCSFCHTGTQGFERHLTAGEVVGEFLAVRKWLDENGTGGEKLTNIVYMGQGEPLHNFENMKKATETFLEPKGLFIGQRRITLSTSGYVPQIVQLKDFPPVNVAISLHSTRDEVRDVLMPINKVYDLKTLFDAIGTIPLKPQRKITYEYLLIDGVNNQLIDIEGLCRMLDRRDSKINLIPFNEYPGTPFKCPSDESIRWFCDELNRRGFFTTIRHSKGRDILAACGQLKTYNDKLLSKSLA